MNHYSLRICFTQYIVLRQLQRTINIMNSKINLFLIFYKYTSTIFLKIPVNYIKCNMQSLKISSFLYL